MTTVAFIGLGIMGGPMAANLVEAGFDVVGYNRSPEKVKELVEKGGRGADDVASAVREADVVVTMGCGEACPVVPGLEREDWPLEDPKGQSMEAVREIRDEVRARVLALLHERGWRDREG